ncbi:MAG TPA: glycoside hydrolase family 9 protein, partial [Verrucomicrobiae bacterium]|nr:glycoside hydrolase family 9 protein [Verrucomicrobiae bacterium]
MCSCRIRTRTKVAGALYFLALLALISSSNVRALDEPLSMPAVGTAGLKVIAPDLLELTLIATKAPPPARPTQWNFVAANSQYVLPTIGKFVVTADGLPALVHSVGFKRRPIYAPFKVRDLRIGNYLYLKLLTPLHNGQNVQVVNPDGTLWSSAVQFTTTVDPLRFSPAIHVNQQGYVPNFPKKAIVGYYVGTLGELNIPASAGFQIVQSSSGQVVYSGNLVSRGDQGYTFSPAPYQQVYEADFSSFTTPGEYKLVVPGLGASYSFRIDEGAAAAFARTYALGLYHQRCGTDNVLPFTRDTHDVCHAAKASVPNMTFTAVNKGLADLLTDSPTPARQTAPALKDVNSSLYPFVNTNAVDVSGGHHDAGDYSKYTINSAQLVHTLIFAVDNFAGVASLDNLGLPESGDGFSDVLQEAKWEADFLAKMQDDDGGFYFLVYPRNRAYEDNVLPDHGDPQIVFPKNTAVTAAAAAALAQTASSPLFKRTYPNAAANYLSKALKAWGFLQTAFAKYGRDGAYQKISHYGNEFMHDDEIAWAAAELFLATGDHSYENELISHFDPSDRANLQDGWVRLWEGYGCAIRAYAFAASSGRISADQLNSDYL